MQFKFKSDDFSNAFILHYCTLHLNLNNPLFDSTYTPFLWILKITGSNFRYSVDFIWRDIISKYFLTSAARFELIFVYNWKCRICCLRVFLVATFLRISDHFHDNKPIWSVLHDIIKGYKEYKLVLCRLKLLQNILLVYDYTEIIYILISIIYDVFI